MDHLPKTQPAQTSKFGKESLGIAALFVLGGVFLLGAFMHHHSDRATNTLAQNHKIQGAMGKAMGTFNKQLLPSYPVHMKTVSLDTFDKQKHFPAVAALVIDGKLVFAAKQPKFFDRYLSLTRGSHSVVIKMWDSQKKLTEKVYQVNVGNKAPEQKKVAQR